MVSFPNEQPLPIISRFHRWAQISGILDPESEPDNVISGFFEIFETFMDFLKNKFLNNDRWFLPNSLNSSQSGFISKWATTPNNLGCKGFLGGSETLSVEEHRSPALALVCRGDVLDEAPEIGDKNDD